MLSSATGAPKCSMRRIESIGICQIFPDKFLAISRLEPCSLGIHLHVPSSQDRRMIIRFSDDYHVPDSTDWCSSSCPSRSVRGQQSEGQNRK